MLGCSMNPVIVLPAPHLMLMSCVLAVLDAVSEADAINEVGMEVAV